MRNWDPDERAQLQLERLQSTLNRAYRNVPFHRNRQNEMARETGSDPSLIENLADIAAFPFMTRKHLGEHYPYGLFAVPLRDIVRIHTAPGTSINPTVTGYTKQDLSNWQKMVSRALQAAGLTSHDILQISLDVGLANWGRDYKDGGEALEIGVIPNTLLSAEKHLMVLRDYRTSALVTTPSGALKLAEQMLHSDINSTALNLKRVMLIGEPVSESLRRQIENDLHAEAWSHFGMSEIPGPAIAFECEHHNGLHIQEDHFLAEIIDPDTGEVLPEGETGELVLTTLTTRAFPLIRFRTGEGAMLISEPCPCGRPMKRMTWLESRTDDILSINGVKVHKDQIRLQLTQALGKAPVHRHFVKKFDKNTASHLEVWVQLEKTLFSDEIKMLERRIYAIKSLLEENLGIPVSIKLKENI